MERGGPDSPDVPRLEDDVRDLEHALWQFAMLVQPEDVYQRGQQRGTERHEILVQRVPNPDTPRRLERVLRGGDGQRHDFLKSIADEEDAQGLREVICCKRLADRLAVPEAPRVSVVSC